MRTVRNINVCVSPELYHQTRQLAAKYDTTVSGVVAYLLQRLPDALERTRYPVGGVKRDSSTSKSSVGEVKQQTSTSRSSFAPDGTQAPQAPNSPQPLAAKELPAATPRDSSAP
jgi:hypothetical protein